jgi:hypothetical protein
MQNDIIVSSKHDHQLLEKYAISLEMAEHYTDIKEISNDRLIGILPLLFHWTIHVNIHPVGYDDRYCFASYDLAKDAFDKWTGEGDPSGWHKHPSTGRRRDLATGKEWIEF